MQNNYKLSSLCTKRELIFLRGLIMRIKNNRTLETELSLDPTEDCVGIVVGDRDERY